MIREPFPTATRAGFSLLEVLVALAIVALALTALTRAAGVGSIALEAERERVLATFIVANVIAESEIARVAMPVGESDGAEAAGGRDWYWRRVVQDTPDPAIRRVDVSVYRDAARAQRVASQTGFVAR